MRGSIIDYNEMNLNELINAIKGFREYEYDNYKQQWERSRWLAWCGLQPHRQKNKSLSQKDLILFEWETDTTQQINKEKFNAMLLRLAKRDNINPELIKIDV